MSYTTELDSDTANRIDFGHRVPELCQFKLNRAGRITGYIGDKDKAEPLPLITKQVHGG